MTPEGGSRRPAGLHVLVQQFTGDAPPPVGLSAPDHEKASSHPRRIRAIPPAHPGDTPERRGELISPERRLRDDLHRRDADLRGDVEKGSPSLDRRHPGPHEDRVVGVEVDPGRSLGRLESLSQSLLSCADVGDVGRRKRQLAKRLLRASAIRQPSDGSPGAATLRCASVRECPLRTKAEGLSLFEPEASLADL
jgi:hypothetical protein